MTTTTVPQQITATGVDTFTGRSTGATLRVYDTGPGQSGDHVAVDIKMTPDVVAETIADLAHTLKDNAAYGALAEAVAAFFDAEAVAS